MNESDQIRLSRYLDGDLSPLDRKNVEAMLAADPAARRLAAEYARMQRFVQELPREPLNHDLAPLVQASIARNGRLLKVPAGIPRIAGVLAASVLIGTFAIAYQSLNDANLRENRVLSPTISSGSNGQLPLSQPPGSFDQASEGPADAVHAAESPEKPAGAEKTADSALAPSIMMAHNQSGAKTPSGEKTRTDDGKVPAALDARFRDFLKASESIDRKHSLRLHVHSASERQIASILTVISRFRSPETTVIQQNAANDGDASSLAYVALIPTVRFNEFRKALKAIPEIEIEMDLAESGEALTKGQPNEARIVEKDEIARAADFSGKAPTPSREADANLLVRRQAADDDVPDAISKPLQAGDDDVAASGTLDQVVIWIRTDPLRAPGDKAKPTRPR